MLSYLCKRLLSNLTALFVIVSITFFLMKAIPGDPFTQEKTLPKEVLHSLYEHYHLNDPWYAQYGHYLLSVVTWDLGPSFTYKGRSVNEIIASSFPVSLLLGLEALVFALFFGLLFGTLAALKARKWQDYGTIALSTLGISVPSFILAACLQYLFALKLDLFPVARWGSFEQTILPAIALGALPAAFIARLTRASMIEILSLDYIKTARAKGLSTLRILTRHVLRNALLPLLTYLGTLTANILTGSFIIEKIFGIPGLGQWFINSISNRDYTVIMGVTVFYSVILLTSIFLVDLAYSFLDPRMRRE